ncbi:MAG: NAD(P)/FAD-dependent oxidoreductase [Deltaproteobacteria bacterium]|nr:NAD(P)/FAD-dependent oxidoreductase [Deltaproteobacteria bacterium]
MGEDIRGKTIAVIGGGPGGSATAIRLMHLSRERGLGVRVVLFEGKDFERHYNQCVGVLSPPIEEILRGRLAVELPYEIFKRQIYGYRLHAGGKEILLVGAHRAGATYAVRRVMFDRFLLECAERAGVEVSRSRVTGIDFPPTGRYLRKGRRDRVFLYTEGGMLKADAVVGAFGLDDGMIDIFETATGGRYRRPGKFIQTYVAKIHVEPSFIEKKLGDIIYAYLFPPGIPNLEFGAITPKGDHIIVNVAGADAAVEDIFAFLSTDVVRDHLPPVSLDEQEVYRGKFPGAPSRGAVGDLYLTVGDATGWLRPFKGKGINMAIETGILAADTLVECGISLASFRRYEERTRLLREDYLYGTWMRNLCKVGEVMGTLGTVLSMAKVDQGIHDALFNAVSGHDSFRNIFRRYARPAVLADVAWNYLNDRRRKA